VLAFLVVHLVPANSPWTPSTVRAQTPEILVAAGARERVTLAPGRFLEVPVLVSQSGESPFPIRSLDLAVQWAPERLVFDDLERGDFGSLTVVSRSTDRGFLAIALFGGDGTTEPFRAFTLRLSASASTGPTEVSLLLVAVRDDHDNSLNDFARSRDLQVCVAHPAGRRGDVNRDDRIDVLDAQQIARFGASLPVTHTDDFLRRGDVTRDGRTDVLDAQRVARFATGRSAEGVGELIPGSCEPGDE